MAAQGGSTFGPGTTVAAQGQLATNVVLGSSQAYIDGKSTVTATTGGVSVDAENTELIDARLHSSSDSSGQSVGITLAFNSLGWKPVNALFNAIDALIGDPILSNTFKGQAANTQAYIHQSSVSAGGDLSVIANANEQINSTVSNAATSTASGIYGQSGSAFNGILTSNKVNGTALAYVDEGNYTYSTRNGTQTINSGDKVYVANGYAGGNGTVGSVYSYSGTSGSKDLGNTDFTSANGWTAVPVTSDTNQKIASGGTLKVAAQDNAGVFSNIKIVAKSTTTSDGGASILQGAINNAIPSDYTTTPVGGATTKVQSLAFGNTVHLADSYDTPKYTTTPAFGDTTKLQQLQTGDVVQLDANYTAGGVAGGLYRYTGANTTNPIDLASTDYSTGPWVKIGGTNGGIYKYMGTTSAGQNLDLNAQDYSNLAL